MVRKTAAYNGLANSTRKVCSSARPVMPTGMVATTSSQASRSVDVSIRRVRSVRTNAPTIRTQSRQ